MHLSSLALIAVAVLTACGGNNINNAPQPGDNIDLPPIQWRVRDKAGLEAAYVNSNMRITNGDRLSGFAGWDGDRAVVYTLPPTRVDDAATLTLGHEIMHVALGSYHE